MRATDSMLNGAGCQWSRSTRTYLFEGPDGTVSLFDLFDGRRQLIIYHFMFDPSWDDGCPSCTNLVDNIPSVWPGIQADEHLTGPRLPCPTREA